MSNNTGIEWTEATWNPVVGCERVSPGCAHCYAKTIHDRRHKAFLAGKKVAPQYAVPFEQLQLMPKRVRDPLSRRAPTIYFVNSVSDLFHKAVPDSFLDFVFATMALRSKHTFQILTKRPERMRDYLHARRPKPLPNVWLGVSVENQRWTSRIPILLKTPAAVRFVSCEPLLGPVTIPEYLPNKLWNDLPSWKEPELDWVIVGGESGKGARPMELDWARNLRDECAHPGVPFFLKQLGGERNKLGHEHALLDGRRHVAMPMERVA